MTPLTIVYAVEQWCQQGHRMPKARDLCPAQHLPHWTTVYKAGFSSISSLLHSLSSVHEHESGGLTWLWTQEHRGCLQCGADTRTPRNVCARCMEVLLDNDLPTEEGRIPAGLQQRSTLYRRLTMAQDWEDTEPHV